MNLEEKLKDDLIVIKNAIRNLSKMDLINNENIYDLEDKLIYFLKCKYQNKIIGLISDISIEIEESFVNDK